MPENVSKNLTRQPDTFHMFILKSPERYTSCFVNTKTEAVLAWGTESLLVTTLELPGFLSSSGQNLTLPDPPAGAHAIKHIVTITVPRK